MVTSVLKEGFVPIAQMVKLSPEPLKQAAGCRIVRKATRRQRNPRLRSPWLPELGARYRELM